MMGSAGLLSCHPVSLMWWWMLDGALAGVPVQAEALPVVPDEAEYRRLSNELEALAARGAWSGVERVFSDLLATGVAPSASDWLRAAESARLVGDVGEVVSRLEAARQGAEEDEEIVAWLAALDRRYAKVFLACDLGSNLVLHAERVPFDPDEGHAIAFAQARVRETCLFDGWLPAGTYRFFTHTFDVLPPVQSQSIDLRGTPIRGSQRRELKRAWAEQQGG